MTRIIAGRFGGRTLRTPAGAGTRPTSDRVREALFSALEARGAIVGAAVLDLYAGSGALGLEAVSRGASRAVLVESATKAAGVARANAHLLGLDGSVTVLAAPVARVLAAAPRAGSAPVAGSAPGAGSAPVAGSAPGAGFDLVLLDPPYELSESALTADLVALVAGGWLAADGLVVVERSSRSPEPGWPEGLGRVGSARRYGETSVWLAAAD